MKENDLTPAMQQARASVHAALSDEAISPTSDWHAIDCGCDDTLCPLQPPTGPWLLTEWVAVLAFVNAETGESWMTRLPSEKLPVHHRSGLLHEGLHGFDD